MPISLRLFRVEIISQFDKRYRQFVEIEASSKEVAIEKVKSRIRKGSAKIGSVTLLKEEWSF